jgi:hypothetical protein
MREDALLRAEVTFPFSLETSTLVDSPREQTNVSRPSTTEAESIEDTMTDDWKASSTSTVSQFGAPDVSDPMDLGGDTPQVADVRNVEINSQDVGGSGTTSASLTVQTPPLEDRIHDSSRTVTPNRSDTETLEEESDSEDQSSQDARKLHIWFGDLSRSGFDASYLSLRDQLSDVAYMGWFDRTFSALVEAERTYRQSWASAPRLST